MLKNLAGVLPGVYLFHAGGCFERCFNLVEVSQSDTGAGLGFGEPAIAGGEDFGPEGVGAALFGLDGVDGTAGGGEEVAVAAAGRTEAQAVAGAVDEAGFEVSRLEAEEGGDAEQIVFGDVDEALLIAAADAAGLAGEAEGAA